MEFRNLGNSGLQVSLIGLGANNFGGRIDQEASTAVVHKALEMGITHFDTADSYPPQGVKGRSEEILGAALKGERRNVVIATKAFGRMGEGPYWSGASRKYLMSAVEDSLRRLGTDYIDLLQLHNHDPRTPIEETLRALDDLVHSGKVRYLGSSNYRSWQVVEAAWTAKVEHLTPFISAQNEYNLLEREVERDLAPACQKYGVGVIPYFPIARGFLTGKYRPGEPPPAGTRMALDAPMRNEAHTSRILTDRNYDMLVRLEDFAVERGHTMVELAFSWLASHPIIGTIIAGATKPEQVEENAQAANWRLTPDEMSELDGIMGVSAAQPTAAQ